MHVKIWHTRSKTSMPYARTNRSCSSNIFKTPKKDKKRPPAAYHLPRFLDVLKAIPGSQLLPSSSHPPRPRWSSSDLPGLPHHPRCSRGPSVQTWEDPGTSKGDLANDASGRLFQGLGPSKNRLKGPKSLHERPMFSWDLVRTLPRKD